MPDSPHIGILVIRDPDGPTEVLVDGTTNYQVVVLDGGAGFDAGRVSTEPGVLEEVAHWAIRGLEDVASLLKENHTRLALAAVNYISYVVKTFSDLLPDTTQPG
jgi:hypothetical protein